MREVTEATFDAEVLHAGRPVVVDFWAPWCRPCQPVTALLERLGEEHAERIDVVGVDVDANPGLAARYAVLTLPTTILFADGVPQVEVLGARPRPYFERAFAPWLGAGDG
jgi:thioredoxin 1